MKCDRCKDREAPYCVESCPTGALILADAEEAASGKLKFLKKEGILSLNFVSDKSLSRR
jgi:Fe-S-cluster-containing hydrogenase component 2